MTGSSFTQIAGDDIDVQINAQGATNTSTVLVDGTTADGVNAEFGGDTLPAGGPVPEQAE